MKRVAFLLSIVLPGVWAQAPTSWSPELSMQVKSVGSVTPSPDGRLVAYTQTSAVIAMIAKAFIKQDPFEVWGDGTQIRNWTYIDDIVSGTVLAAEKIDDGTAVNLGTMERIRVIDAVKETLRYTKHEAKIVYRPEMPVGPLNRVAENSLAKKIMGWEPKVKFMDGLHRTIDWYFSNKKREEVEKILKEKLTER